MDVVDWRRRHASSLLCGWYGSRRNLAIGHWYPLICQSRDRHRPGRPKYLSGSRTDIVGLGHRGGPWWCWPDAGYRPVAGYLSAGQGSAWTITPTIMHGLSDLFAHSRLTPLTTAVAPGPSLASSVSVAT